MNAASKASPTYPLSPAQERLIFINEASGADNAYLFPVNLRFRGPVDIDCLSSALDDVTSRHEVLRSRVATVDGALVQVVDRIGRKLEVTDLRHNSPAQALALAEEAAAADARRPFDLRSGWMRAQLLRLSSDDNILLVAIHHVAFDGWSCQVFLREIADAYNARLDGHPPAFERLAITYGEIAEMDRDRSSDSASAEASEFWTEQTRDLPGDLPLPTDRPRRHAPSGLTDRIWWHLGAEETQDIEADARRLRVTVYMLLLAAFELTLAKAGGQDDFFIGGATSGRRYAGSAGLIGLFVNDVPYRSDVNEELTLAELASAVKRRALRVYQHQNLPFEQVVAIARPKRTLDKHPLFQHALVLQPREAEALSVSFRDLDVVGFTTYPEGSALDLTFSFHYEKDGLHLAADFATDLWERSTISRLVDNYRLVLDQFHTDDGMRVAELNSLEDLGPRHIPTISPAGKAQLVDEIQALAATDPQRESGSPTAELIAAVFSDLLNVDAAPETDFFEHGGDSILAMRVVTHLRSAGLALSILDFFQEPSPRRLASLLDGRRSSSTSASPTAPSRPSYVRPEGALRALPMQAWFDSAAPRPLFYNFSSLLRYSGIIEPRLLSRAVAVVLKRHDATRIRFAESSGKLAASYLQGTGHERLQVVDLRELSEAEASERLHNHSADVQGSLTLLGDNPLIQVVLYQCPGDVSRLLIAACHLVMDVVSMHVLAEEVQDAYSDLAAHRPIELAPLSASVQAWAGALHEWAQTRAADTTLVQWDVLRGYASPEVPLDHPGAPNLVEDERTDFFRLSRDESAAVSRYVASTPGVTHEAVILSAVGHALGTRLGERGVVIDIENHGRAAQLIDMDVSRTVGWLTTIYPFPLLTGEAAAGRQGVHRIAHELMTVRHAGLDYAALAAAGRTEFAERSIAYSHAGAVVTRRDSLWQYENLHPQDARHPAMRRRHHIEVDSIIVDGVIRVSLTYSRAQYAPAGMAVLGQSVLANMLETSRD